MPLAIQCHSKNSTVTKESMFEKFLKSKTIAFIALAALFMACSSTEPKGTLEKIKEKDKLTVGIKTDYRPFGFIDPDGKNAGLEVDIAEYLSQEIVGDKSKIEFVPVVASNRIEFLKQGRVDLVIATMTDTEERRQEIDFSENYYSDGAGLLTKKENTFKSWDELKDKKVCGIQGSFYNKELTEKGVKLVNFAGTAEAYKGLQDGRCIGFVYDNSALGGKLLEPEWVKDWHLPLPVILSKPWGMGIRKGDTELLEAVNTATLKMEAEGFIVDGEKKWQIPSTEYVKQRMEKAQAATQ